LKLGQTTWHLPQRHVVFHDYLIKITPEAMHLYSVFGTYLNSLKNKTSSQ